MAIRDPDNDNFGAVSLWDTATGELLRTFERYTENVTSVAFSPDGTRVLSGSADKTMKIWDAVTGALLRIFEGHTGSVNSVAFSPDGLHLLSGSDDKTMKLWNVATGRLQGSFKGTADLCDGNESLPVLHFG